MRIVIAAVCLAAGIAAQNRFDNALNVTFRHGTLRVHTESTHANSTRAPKGVVAIEEGDVSHRMVTGVDGNVLFAYDLSLLPNEAGSYTVRALPARRDYPTIDRAREFSRVRVGETVNLEVLSDASTGERLFDVIQPIAPAVESRRRATPDEEISLDQIQLSINGELVREFRNSWMIGNAVKIALPRIGTVFLMRTPPDDYGFQNIGDVNGKLLTFPVGENRVEILSKSNILKRSETGSVWVYREPQKPSTEQVAVEVGYPEDLLPKR